MTAIKSVFSSLTALLTLATLITGATSFQTTFAQPMMGESKGMGNGVGAGMNFNNPMSFANNIFNASSLYGNPYLLPITFLLFISRGTLYPAIGH